jgi:UDP-N-acetylmuramate dehydrogenase
MKDVVESIEVFDTKTEKIKIFKNKDCRFSYRNSIFRKKKNLIILSVKIKTKKSNTKKIKQYLDYKKQTQPLNFPSAGSIFVNPSGFSAGELIEKCGLKGKKIGNVKISEKHANFILNLGQGKAKDVIKLIKLIKKEVKNKFKVNLEEEIQFLGFKNKIF